jgi:hypothetical protein
MPRPVRVMRVVVLIGSAGGDAGEDKKQKAAEQHGYLSGTGVGLIRFAKQFFHDQLDDHAGAETENSGSKGRSGVGGQPT